LLAPVPNFFAADAKAVGGDDKVFRVALLFTHERDAAAQLEYVGLTPHVLDGPVLGTERSQQQRPPLQQPDVGAALGPRLNVGKFRIAERDVAAPQSQLSPVLVERVIGFGPTAWRDAVFLGGGQVKANWPEAVRNG